MPNTFVVGDIHGADKALWQVLEKAKPGRDDMIIFVGDYVDGWSGSFEVIEMLINLEMSQPCIFIRGNHDIWCQQWLEQNIIDDVWLFHGGQATLDSYRKASAKNKATHLGFFQRMKDYYIDDRNNLFIHAGFASMHGPAKEPFPGSYTWDRSLWEMAICANKNIQKDSPFFPKRLRLFNEIYIGHTPTIHIGSFEPFNAMNVWNMDTGAAFNGSLTMMNINTKIFWQSDRVQDLYTGQTGRNK